jgi:putative ABC transport system ATP-binding protein
MVLPGFAHGAASSPIIRLRSVTKTYRSAAGEFTALSGIDLEIRSGEFLGIIGKSGAGKSTFLNMISGVDHLTGGEVCITLPDQTDSISIQDLDENNLAQWRGRNMGVIYQSFQLLPMLTLLDNIILPMDLCNRYHPIKSRERALELLNLVELDEHAFKLPAQISGGQQQRAAIARALANDPPILIADEPTGSLDSATSDTIFQMFERLVQGGKTIIMVTHDNSLAPRFSRRVYITDGRLTDGSEYFLYQTTHANVTLA